jgi:hypothetical protein
MLLRPARSSVLLPLNPTFGMESVIWLVAMNARFAGPPAVEIDAGAPSRAREVNLKPPISPIVPKLWSNPTAVSKAEGPAVAPRK